MAILVNRRKLSMSLQLAFLSRLTKLLNQNYTIRQSLEFMRFDPQLKSTASQLTVYLQKGHTIHRCFNYLAFHPIVITFMNFSKESGQLSQHLSYCQRLLIMKLNLQKKLMNVLKYPMLLIFVCIVIFSVINMYLFPSLSRTFESLNQHNSLWFFKIMIRFINISFMMFGLLLMTSLVIYIITKRTTIHKRLTIMKQIPIVNKVFRRLLSLQFAYQLYALLISGKNLQESLKLIKTQHYMPYQQYLANLILKQLAIGKSFYESVMNIEYIQDELKWLIKRGEETCTLTDDLQHYTELMLDHLEEKMKTFILRIQPIFYIIIGLLILTIYMLTLFPIYQLMKQI
ncbi:type II secretion system F family protein [Aquisalibacillus elongatus]|nr:type II secretion system F family protein [Aquisalibacillus elongatus]